jgi:hypothetical protein
MIGHNWTLSAPPYPGAPLYQQVLLCVFVPPILSAVLCLLTKARGKGLGTSNSKWIRNASDWVAYLTFSAFFYVLFIAIILFAHLSRR